MSDTCYDLSNSIRDIYLSSMKMVQDCLGLAMERGGVALPLQAYNISVVATLRILKRDETKSI